MTLHSDIPEHAGDKDEADDLLLDVLQHWMDEGKSPATMINSMAELVADVVEQVAMPMH